jgi:transposase
MVLKRRRFTCEFKIETVRLVADGGNNVTQIAQDMGIPPNTLHKWIRQFCEKPDEAFPCSGHIMSEAEHIRQLKREIDRLRMECNILKKAMDSFSKDQK